MYATTRADVIIPIWILDFGELGIAEASIKNALMLPFFVLQKKWKFY